MNRRGTLSEKCVMCGEKVYLMERHMEGTKLYHRKCIRETQRNTLKRESKASASQKSHKSAAHDNSGSKMRSEENVNSSPTNTAKSLLSDYKSGSNRSPDNPFRREMKENVAQVKSLSPPPVKSALVLDREPVKVESKFSRPSDFKTRINDDLSPKSKLHSPTKTSHHRNSFLSDLSPTSEQPKSPDSKKSKFESLSPSKWTSDRSPVKNSYGASTPPVESPNVTKAASKNNESSVYSGLLKSLAGVKKPKDFDEPMQNVYETEKAEKSTNRKSWMAAPGETHGGRLPWEDSKVKTVDTPVILGKDVSADKQKESPKTSLRRSPPLPKFGGTKNTNLQKQDSFNDIFAANKEIVDKYGLDSDSENSTETTIASPTKKKIFEKHGAQKLANTNFQGTKHKVLNGHKDDSAKVKEKTKPGASSLETRLKIDVGESRTHNKKITDHLVKHSKVREAEKTSSSSVSPKSEQKGFKTENDISKYRSKEPVKTQFGEPKSILKSKHNKDIDTSFLSVKNEVTGTQLIGSSDIAGTTNNMSAFNMLDSINLKKYKETKESGQLSLSPASSVDQSPKSVFSKNLTREQETKSGISDSGKVVKNVNDKTPVLSNGKLDGYKAMQTSSVASKGDNTAQTKQNKFDIKSKFDNKPAEITESKPAWMIEAEKRQKARGGKYEDPEFAKVKQLEKEKKGNNMNDDDKSRFTSNIPKRQEPDTPPYSTKTVEMKPKTQVQKTEKVEVVSPGSPKQMKKEFSPRKERKIEVSTEKSRFKSPETSPRATSPSTDDNAALVSILSKQLGRKQGGQGKSTDVVVPSRFGAQKVTSPEFDKDSSLNNANNRPDIPVIGSVSDKRIEINDSNSNRNSQAVVSPPWNEKSKAEEKPTTRKNRTSTPNVTTSTTSGDLVMKKVIAAPPGSIESEYVLASDPSLVELKTRIVPDKPFSFDSDDELSEVDSVDSSNSDSAQHVVREKEGPPVRKVSAHLKYYFLKFILTDIKLLQFL